MVVQYIVFLINMNINHGGKLSNLSNDTEINYNYLNYKKQKLVQELSQIKRYPYYLFCRTITSKFILFGTILSSSVYMSYNTQYKSSASLFTLAVLYCISYIEFLRIRAHRDLKSIVSLQNDFFDLCKKGLKILKYGYKIKLHQGKSSQQFS